MDAFTPHDGHVLVIGASGTDVVGRAETSLQAGTSTPGQVRVSHGGVARNVAENLARLGMETILITAVGEDAPGRQLLHQVSQSGVNVEYALAAEGFQSGSYVAVLDEAGNLHLALDDMRVIDAITSQHLRECQPLFQQAAAVVLDANLPPKTLNTAVSLAGRAKVPIAADPTSVALAPRLAPHLEKLWLVTPNEAEAEALCPHPVPHADREIALDAARHLVSEGVDIAIITMAEYGVGYATTEVSGHVPAMLTTIVDPTGAGDALTAAVVFALLNDIPVDEAVRLGVSAAYLTLRTPGSVFPDLSLEVLYDQLR
ncbi:MAG: carbohydrate kinase family protein [Anaerolineales bacterium]